MYVYIYIYMCILFSVLLSHIKAIVVIIIYCSDFDGVFSRSVAFQVGIVSYWNAIRRIVFWPQVDWIARERGNAKYDISLYDVSRLLL